MKKINTYDTTSGTYVEVEVTDEVYFTIKREEWREEKRNERRSRCTIGRKRCMEDCSNCEHFRSGTPLSIDQMMAVGYDPADERPMTEDQVLDKLLKEDVDRTLRANFTERERTIFWLVYHGYRQREIAEIFGISQPLVNRLIRKLRAYLSVVYADLRP